jgi:hypothetical protein
MIASPTSPLINWLFRIEIGVLEAGWSYPNPEQEGQGLENRQLVSTTGIKAKEAFGDEK